ncbi:MAG: ABC transporter ATP-binding protein/permease [Methylococcales bacterium]
MDWNNELLTTLVWLGKAFILSLIGLFLIVAALSRWTQWGRQFKRLAWPYFMPSRSMLPMGMLTLIILLTLFAVRLSVLFSFWYNGFYSAMQNLDAKAFWFMLGVFSILAAIHVGRALLNFYLQQAFLIRWRRWLTDTLMEAWLQQQAYYRSRYLPDDADNPDQRIQQDVDSFVSTSLSLSMGLLDAIVSLFSFTLILWGLSGALAIAGVEIPRAMVFLVYLYVLIATLFAVKLGRPLIALNFLNEKLNADFRYALIRVREYGESIAFFKGERIEQAGLMQRFAEVISNKWAIVYRSLKFQGFNFAISQVAVVFPFIAQAPRLFDKQITLGDMMQTVEAFGQVQTALSFFRSSYDDFTSYRAVLNRLSGFLDIMEATAQLPKVQMAREGQQLLICALNVNTQAQTPLLENLNFALAAGDSLLIRGASGVGKTTLLRAIAGLWPFTDGRIVWPESQETLFLPQKPYIPLGSLRTALYYPAPAEYGTQTAEILVQCQLPHLVNRLDDEANWTGVLSLGEQQRLAIGRAIISQAGIIFLDEASSAMDEGLEYAMYCLLKASLPQSIIISVGHRSSLLAFHAQQLELLGEGKWRLS